MKISAIFDHTNREYSGDPLLGLSRILNSVTSYQQYRLESTRRLIYGLSTSWNNIREEERKKSALKNHDFNPLRCFKIKETDHSKILGGLLDPHGTHGQGNLFLHSFLGILDIEPPDGNWAVEIESGCGDGRVDILLHRQDPPSVVIIENKVHSAEDQEGQLYRYWFHEMYKVYEHNPNVRYNEIETAKRFRLIYLPPRGYSRPSEWSMRRPSDSKYASCPYVTLPSTILDCRSFQTDVADWLKKMVDPKRSQRLNTFLTLYAEIWSI